MMFLTKKIRCGAIKKPRRIHGRYLPVAPNKEQRAVSV